MGKLVCWVCAVGLCVVSPVTLAAGPRTAIVVAGNHVLIKAYTDNTKWHCTYTVSAIFADGTTAKFSGQTDPATNGTPLTAADVTFVKAVGSANLTAWDCTVIP